MITKYTLTVTCLLFCFGCGSPEPTPWQQAQAHLAKMRAEQAEKWAAIESQKEALANEQDELNSRFAQFLTNLSDDELNAFNHYTKSLEQGDFGQREAARRLLVSKMRAEYVKMVFTFQAEQAAMNSKAQALNAEAEKLKEEDKAVEDIHRIVYETFSRSSQPTQPQLNNQERMLYGLSKGFERAMMLEVELQRANRPVYYPPPAQQSNYWQEENARQEYWDRIYRRAGVNPP